MFPLRLWIENRYRPFTALDAIRKLIRNKEDTAQVFRLLVALRGMSFVRNVRRFQKSPVGQRVLAEKCDLVDVLSNRGYLEGLPAGSLGREFIAFLDGCGITPQGLTEAAREAGLDDYELSEDARRYEMRVRVQHDIWHVVGGYGCDGFGEVCNVAFSYPHTRNIGFMVIAIAGGWNYAKAFPGEPIMSAMWQGLWRGYRATWLPGVDWEAMLPLPLSEVRRELGVRDLPTRYLAAPKVIEKSFTASPVAV
ncbi:MAG: Coq4 family protein [Sphingomonadaceae bacterium]